MKVTTHTVGSGGATLTAYVQDRSEELQDQRLRPAVLVLPGGGYLFTSDREAEPVALAYLAAGFNAFVLRYAVGEGVRWQLALDDGRAALAWLREHAAEVDVAEGQVAVVGFSAGGHLGASLSTICAERPDAAVLGYPWIPAAEDVDEADVAMTGVLAAVDERTPPTFIFHTVPDEIVPVQHSLALLTALADRGVPFEAHLYPVGAHGLSLAAPHTSNGRPEMVEPVVSAWLADSVRFLTSTFGLD